MHAKSTRRAQTPGKHREYRTIPTKWCVGDRIVRCVGFARTFRVATFVLFKEDWKIRLAGQARVWSVRIARPAAVIAGSAQRRVICWVCSSRTIFTFHARLGAGWEIQVPTLGHIASLTFIVRCASSAFVTAIFAHSVVIPVLSTRTHYRTLPALEQKQPVGTLGACRVVELPCTECLVRT
jgi:hypothetical protein